MMFFRKYFDQRAIRKTCMDKIERHSDDIRVVPLNKPMSMIDRYNDVRDYVARMGLFTEDMMDINIPYITWYCCKDGQIWTEWYYMPPYRGEEYQRYRHLLDYSNSNTIHIPMTSRESDYIKDLSLETWTMAKLDGSLDDIGKVRYDVGGGITELF